jgi:hypothetical protein
MPRRRHIGVKTSGNQCACVSAALPQSHDLGGAHRQLRARAQTSGNQCARIRSALPQTSDVGGAR